MKKFFREHGIWVLFATAVIAVSLSLMSFFSNTSSPLSNLAGIIASPFRSAYTAVTGWITDKQNYYQDVTALEEENAALRRENAILKAQNRLAQTNNEENARLRDLLNLRPQQREFQYESAMVVDHTSSNWTRTLTLNKGSFMGISPKDCVIDAQGYLVGVVDQVGTNWATVLTTIDTDFEMGAIVFRSGEAAIASGSFNLMADSLLQLNYISSEEALLNGDLVVTSGLGGYYPSNLVIGEVEEVITDDSGAMDYALLRPAVDFDELTEVFVITDFTIVD